MLMNAWFAVLVVTLFLYVRNARSRALATRKQADERSFLESSPFATATAAGSGGHFHFQAADGLVLASPGTPTPAAYSHISRVDVDEWRKAYPGEPLAGRTIDILDLGFWYEDGEGVRCYEPPAYDWRAAYHQA